MKTAVEAVLLKDAISDSKQRRLLAELYRTRKDLDFKLKAGELNKKQLNQQIEEILLIYDRYKVEVIEGAGLHLIPKTKRTIQKDVLLRLGVEPAKILGATKTSEYNEIRLWPAEKKNGHDTEEEDE